MSDTMIKFTGYYLEHRSAGHQKFYAIFVGEDGSYITNWGRIGSGGQSAHNGLPTAADARAMGEKQMYAKMSKGYQMFHNGIEFEVNEDVMKMIASGRYSAATIAASFWQAQQEGRKVATSAVLSAYDAFLAEIERALDQLTSAKGTFEGFQELDELWAQVQDKHDEAETIMSLARTSAVSSLVSS